MQFSNSQTIFNRAKDVIPGGVNSPVRAFRSVGGSPVFMKSAKGAYLFDEDGNSYLDLINSWGPMILGHAHERIEKAIVDAASRSFSFGAPTYQEVIMAEKIVSMVPSIEKVRMVNSGTEATMSAIRVARGFTGRNKIIKFEGCYHGHGDSFLIAAGSGAMTMGVPDSPGVPEGVAADTLTARYNDLFSVQTLIDANPNQIAALIVEPVVGNMGCVVPNDGFLEGLRDLCTANGIVYIFDEVMTGFRLAKGGAQERFNIKPDMTTLGKIIGGGLPVGAYGGRREIMNFVAPQGPVYQAGTLSGNPISMAAGLAMLTYLDENPNVYTQIEAATQRVVDGFRANDAAANINHIGSMFTLFFNDQKIIDFDTAKTCNKERYAAFFHSMLNQGVYLPPSQFESWFFSTALTESNIATIIEAHRAFISSY